MNQIHQSTIPPGMLMRIIEGKQILISNYGKLLHLLSNRQDVEMISRIHMNEAEHLKMLIALYVKLFCDQPALSGVGDSQIYSYISGIKDIITSELNMSVSYSSIIFSDSDADVRHVFDQVLTDDIRHTTRLNFMYTQSIEMRMAQLIQE